MADPVLHSLTTAADHLELTSEKLDIADMVVVEVRTVNVELGEQVITSEVSK